MQCTKRLYSTSSLRIESFLKNRTDLTSTSYRGTLFELQSLHALESTAKMQLAHVGGRGDRGIDLRGTWAGLPVIVQCKTVKEGCTPEHIRGMMGTASMFKKRQISILATRTHTYTSEVLSHFQSSPLPLGLASVNDITLVTLMFNKSAQSFLKDRVLISTVFDALGNESLHVDILK
ncbi:hypothetical protein G6F56_001255 [Rhizopus delemar]|uniref:Restriction endonuclease type IV Mrr domain-containing protein n=1 Tax=Rhizopus stolonifer TaxID=4846 RepID=A0A367IIT4_RHIST|nr:hypothetical protein G6F56_001255 [Rhizopus delemar]RCH77584.1 hypothetical protein CU098_004687 [Rhizopus stolonifer]